MIEPIKMFKFSYSPFDIKFPICRCELTIVARDRKEAELIAINNNYKFFNQDVRCEVSEVMEGWRETEHE